MRDIPSNREMRQMFFEVTGKLSANRFSEYESFVGGWKACHAQSQTEVAQLRSEVAMLHDALYNALPEDAVNQDEMGGCIFCGKSVGKHGYGYATNAPKDHEEDCAWFVGRRILVDTQATAQAYEQEVKAETLEKAACKLQGTGYDATLRGMANAIRATSKKVGWQRDSKKKAKA